MTWQKTSTTRNACSTWTSRTGTRRFAARLHRLYALLVVSIEGREDTHERSRFASLLFHRLLFLYLLQQRGLLANDPCYLQHRLAQNIDDYGFYCDVLCPFFHASGQIDDFPALPANVFIELEGCHCAAIRLPNAVFARIFAFFDEFRCYLGDSNKQEGKTPGLEALDGLFSREISQKELGAYYTPVEVTTYIA
ncbi:MAG: hypothetical protein ACRDHW_12150, partial [Ktedonobacteraceae bacterium]